MNKLTMTECAKKRLEETYLVVYAIKNELNIKKAEYIEATEIYTLIGIDKKGYRHLLNIIADRIHNNRYWLDFFETLKSRGLKNILFLSVDDNKNMKRCAKVAFPSIQFVDSLTDIIPKFYKYSFEKDEKKLSSKIHALYTQATLQEFKQIFETFKKEYNNVIHQKLIEKYLGNIESLYKYSHNIRLLLFKHSANIYIYDKLRLMFNKNQSYVTDMDEIYEKLEGNQKCFGFTSFKKREWTLILNDFIQIYSNIEFI